MCIDYHSLQILVTYQKKQILPLAVVLEASDAIGCPKPNVLLRVFIVEFIIGEDSLLNSSYPLIFFGRFE